MSALEATALEVTFGGVRAVRGVDLVVDEGHLVGLIGPNGAGKTTVIDALTGFVASQGSVRLTGDELSHLPPHVRARRGLVRTWQGVDLFDDLTVAENLAVAAARADDAVEQAAVLVGLTERLDVLAGDLHQGERRMAGIGRAIAARPRVVCLDEPAAGLDRAEVVDLGRRLRSIAATGVGLLLVDHDMGLVLQVCDHVVVLDFGTVIASGAPASVQADPAVIAAYLGVPDAHP